METSTSAQADAGLGAVRSQDRRAGDRLGLRQARSAHADEEPGDVRARGRHRADHGHPDPRSRHRRRATSASSSRSSCGCGSRCCSPTSPKRSPRAAARRRPTRCASQRTETQAKLLTGDDRQGLSSSCPATELEGRRRRAGRGRRHHPVRRRGDRRHRLGQRGGDHRRIGAGHPRVRRRPLGGHRRHAGALRLDQACASPRRRARPSSTA